MGTPGSERDTPQGPSLAGASGQVCEMVLQAQGVWLALLVGGRAVLGGWVGGVWAGEEPLLAEPTQP